MKKRLLLAGLLFGTFLTSNAQTTIFEDSFEAYENFAITNVGQWTLRDIDASTSYGFNGADFTNSGDPYAFIVFNSSATTPPLTPVTEGTNPSDYSARTGSKAMASFAAVIATPGSEGANGPNNDWLISPQIQLAGSGNVLRFWAKSATAQYGLESFKVGVSTTTTETAAFTVISGANAIQAPGVVWTQYEFNLDNYAGQNIFISINCVSNDKFVFMVDDFAVTSGDTAGINDALSSKFSVYPNPANNVINVGGTDALVNNVSIIDLNGRTVKTAKFDNVANAQINISDLSAGVYMMNVASDKGSITKKIVKN